MPKLNKQLLFVFVFGLMFSGFCSANGNKPKPSLAADGFPTGLDTPEGAASDLERAYIQRDSNLFAIVCIGLYANHSGPAQYDELMRETIARLDRESSSKVETPLDPRAINKVFAARHFSREGPASYGYAAFDFRDVVFVDVQVQLRNGKLITNRILVIKTADDQWHAHPAPKVSPLLCFGIDEEKPSQTDFSEAYKIAKQNQPN
ncbi:MAG TPA: hypothetical protein VKD70_01585 [Candidatus Acidoferrum sp.]|nr:hypothetical protein [Candidatus Acidoferrum sp.]